MKAQSFDLITCRDCVGDERSRTLESKARKDAERNVYEPPHKQLAETYWDAVRDSMELLVYRAAFQRRKERLERMQ